MITEKEIQLALVQLIEGGNFASADLEDCPWPQHVKDSVMKHTQDSLVRGIFRGLLSMKRGSMDFTNFPIQEVGQAFDELFYEFMMAYVKILTPIENKEDIAGEKLWQTIMGTFEEAYKEVRKDILVKLEKINHLSFS